MFGRLFHKERPKKSSSIVEQTRRNGFSIDHLHTLIPFNDTNEATRIIAMSFTELVEMKENERLFEVGMNDEYDYYLLDGTIALVAADGREAPLNHTSEKAKNSLAYLRPRKFAAVVRSKTALFAKISHHVLEMIFNQTKANHHWESEEVVYIGQVHQESLYEKVEQKIHQGTLLLPSLPEVAQKVRMACQSADSSAATITKVVAHDTAISAKLLAASNSPIFRGVTQIHTLQDAIARLGRQTTQHLVYYYATKELFQTHYPLLRKLFLAAWHRSLERAVMAQTLANHYTPNLNTDEAFLAGLLFRIGDLVVFQYVAEIEENPNEIEKVQHIAETYSAKISKLLVTDWHLPPAVSESLENGAHWRYTCHNPEPDYAELMVVTNIHLRMLHNNMKGLPPLNKIPAINRILSDDATPDTSIIIEAKKALAEFKLL